MKYTYALLFVFMLLLSHFPALSNSAPAPAASAFSDTALSAANNSSDVPVPAKKASLFVRLKNTVLGFLGKSEPLKKSGLDTRSKVALIGLGLVVLGIAIPVTGGIGAALWLVPAGVLTSLVALFIKRDKSLDEVTAGGKKKRKTNIALIIAGILGAGLIALIIANPVWGGH